MPQPMPQQDGSKAKPATPQRDAVREWAYLLSGISIVTVLGGAAWFAIVMKRRRNRLRELSLDWKERRKAEQDAWSAAAKRLKTPTAAELEDDPPEPEPKDKPS